MKIKCIPLLFILFPILCLGQNKEAVIERYFSAIGGRDAWLNIATMEKTAVFTRRPDLVNPMVPASRFEATSRFEYLYKRPNKIKVTIYGFGHTLGKIMCFDGQQMWIKFGGKEATILPKEHADFFVANSPIGVGDLLVDETAAISYQGRKVVGGVEYEVLEIKRPEWVISYEHMFDTETGLFVCAIAPLSEARRVTYSKEYKNFKGVMIPTVEQVFFNANEESVSEVTKIVVNEDIDDAQFRVPK